MNRVLTFAALALALLSLGCGGSSTGSTGNAVVTVPYTPVVEAVLLSASQAGSSTAPVVEDAQNIQLGELIQFQLVGYDSSGGRHVLSSSGWTSTDKTNEYGTIDSTSGVFTVGQNSMQGTQTVQAYDAAGVPHSAFYKVNPTQSRVVGQVVSSAGRAAVRGVQIQFFDSSSQVVGAVTTSYDGTFRASVPTSAVSFTVNPNAGFPSSFWQSFTYGINSSVSSTTPFLYVANSSTLNPSFVELWNRSGSPIGTSLQLGENFMFQIAQPSTLLTPVVPAASADPLVIVLSSRTTYTTDPCYLPNANCQY